MSDEILAVDGQELRVEDPGFNQMLTAIQVVGCMLTQEEQHLVARQVLQLFGLLDAPRQTTSAPGPAESDEG